jgi:hypothetical protein
MSRPHARSPLALVGVLAALFAVLPTLSGRAAQAPLPSGRDVVNRHVSAIGGAAAFKAIRSMHARGRFEIRDNGLAGDFELFTARPNRMLYRVTMAGLGVVENGFDGKVGWSINPVSGPELMTGEQLAEAALDAWFDGTLYEPDHVKSLETLERTTFDGRPAFKVRVTYVAGRDATEYFDVETGFQLGSEADRATPQGVVPTTNILRNYRRTGPVTTPTTFVQRALGFEQVVTIATVDFDTVPDSRFTPPPSVTALIGR